jgi:hypothetical protein
MCYYKLTEEKQESQNKIKGWFNICAVQVIIGHANVSHPWTGALDNVQRVQKSIPFHSETQRDSEDNCSYCTAIATLFSTQHSDPSMLPFIHMQLSMPPMTCHTHMSTSAIDLNRIYIRFQNHQSIKIC